MKITKRQLKRIIREERANLVKEAGPGMIHSPGDVIEAVKDAIMRGFIEQGEVFTNDIYDRLGAEGYSDPEIDSALNQLADQYL